MAFTVRSKSNAQRRGRGRISPLLVQAYGYESHRLLETRGFKLVRVRAEEAKKHGFVCKNGYIELYIAPTMQHFVDLFDTEGFRLSKSVEIDLAKFTPNSWKKSFF